MSIKTPAKFHTRSFRQYEAMRKKRQTMANKIARNKPKPENEQAVFNMREGKV